jgi:hypothetical protein
VQQMQPVPQQQEQQQQQDQQQQGQQQAPQQQQQQQQMGPAGAGPWWPPDSMAIPVTAYRHTRVSWLRARDVAGMRGWVSVKCVHSCDCLQAHTGELATCGWLATDLLHVWVQWGVGGECVHSCDCLQAHTGE